MESRSARETPGDSALKDRAKRPGEGMHPRDDSGEPVRVHAELDSRGYPADESPVSWFRFQSLARSIALHPQPQRFERKGFAVQPSAGLSNAF